MALPATDAFTGTNSDDLTVYSSNWAVNLGSITIQSNAFQPNNSGSHSGYHWTADTFDDDQYAQIVVTAQLSGTFTGATVRAASGTTTTFYKFNTDSSSSYLTKHVAGSLTVIANGGETVAVNDVVRLEVEGTTLDPQINGTTGARGTQTDSAISSGSAGVGSYGSSTPTRGDDWEGGNVTPPDTTAPVLSSPTGTTTGSTTASGTVSTDEANGTLYFLATVNSTETAATIKAGSSQSVSATGVQNVSFTGLTASTTYYAHYVHDDAASNESNVVSSTSFTTNASGISIPIAAYHYNHNVGSRL